MKGMSGEKQEEKGSQLRPWREVSEGEMEEVNRRGILQGQWEKAG